MAKFCAFFFLLVVFEVHARRVMVTTFDPFDQRPQNGSQLAGEVLRSLSSTSETGIEYVICNLPVVYDQAAEEAKRCYEQMSPKPDMVISTGEADCEIRVETRALNLDAAGIADNNGRIRDNEHIDVNATPYTFMNYPAADMFCSAEVSAALPLRSSISPGVFVCNNTAYRLSRYFQSQPTPVPYGFIHIPGADCMQYQTSPQQVGTTLHTMIQAGMNALPSWRETAIGVPLAPECVQEQPIPATTLSPLLAVARADCQAEMRRQTMGVYEVDTHSH